MTEKNNKSNEKYNINKPSVKILLWDIDGTVLNFLEAERAAIRKGFERFNMGECTDEMLSRYSSINKDYWLRLERGEMTKQEILVERFKDFFDEYSLNAPCVEDFNDQYQTDLGDTICFNDNSYELINDLANRYKQYVVSNGTARVQHKKLRLSGLDKIFDGIYISDEVGFEKPAKNFFDRILEDIRKEVGEIKLSEVMIIGDSLTSDIAGGNNAGILTCWYNPNELDEDYKGRIDYQINDLNELRYILCE